MSRTVAIAAGGTGGHVLPGLAIAAAVRALDPAARVIFIGTRHGIEHRLAGEAGYDVHGTGAKPFGSGVRLITGPASMIGAMIESRTILRREAASVVIGMGGYPSVPVVIAARTLGLPSIIHEANAVPGLANQIAARATPNVAVCFPDTAASFAPRDARVTGMPLRPAIARFDRGALRGEAMKEWNLDPSLRTILCFGGSLGAASIGEAVVALADGWRDRLDVQLVLATGADKVEAVVTRLAGIPWIRVEPYIDRMDLAYAAADVVIARAGSSTVAELAATGTPSILVPFPHARRREQHQNARLLTDAGGATLLEDAELSTLGAVIGPMIDDPARLASMGEAARSVATLDAAEQIAAWAFSLAGEAR